MPLLSRSAKLKHSTHTFTGVVSYPSGGMPFDPKAEASMFSDPSAVFVNAQSTTYDAWYNHADKKIVVRVTATGAEAGAIDLSAVNFRILALYP